jgi:hypothetical protein
LDKFDAPRTIRIVEWDAFSGTAIEEVDQSETVAESAVVHDMILLERLTLPRLCVLAGTRSFAALRSLTFGRARGDRNFGFGSDVRVEGFIAPQGNCTGLEGACTRRLPRLHACVEPERPSASQFGGAGSFRLLAV